MSMVTFPRRAVTSVEIQRWVPRRFGDIVGNEEMLQYFQEGIQSNGFIANTLITGPSRSGKTATVKMFVKSLLCARRDPLSGSACGTCSLCEQNLGTLEHIGLYAYADEAANSRPMPINYKPIDCPDITEAALREELKEMRDFDGLRIVYLDEIHRLAHRSLDELLLKRMEERNFVWIASSATTKGLERMFINRFPVKLRTTLPSRRDLATFLATRCKEWQLDWDEPKTIIRLVERCNQVAGLALHVLARAAVSPKRTVTIEMVESHMFDEEE